MLAENVMAPGGKGANQAVAARRMGARTAMIGAIGDDAFGATLAETLASDGIDLDGLERFTGEACGMASIAIDGRGKT